MEPAEIRRHLEADFARMCEDFTRPLTRFGMRERVRSQYQELLNAEGAGGQASVSEAEGGTFNITITYPS